MLLAEAFLTRLNDDSLHTRRSRGCSALSRPSATRCPSAGKRQRSPPERASSTNCAAHSGSSSSSTVARRSKIERPASLGGGVRLVERTNIVLESFFHRIKHAERRRSGRKTLLSQDLEHLPPEAALALNLNCPDYVEILCGCIDRLPASFAELDAGNRSLSLPARTRSAPATIDSVTRSMTTVDRRLVRTTSSAASTKPRAAVHPALVGPRVGLEAPPPPLSLSLRQPSLMP